MESSLIAPDSLGWRIGMGVLVGLVAAVSGAEWMLAKKIPQNTTDAKSSSSSHPPSSSLLWMNYLISLCSVLCFVLLFTSLNDKLTLSLVDHDDYTMKTRFALLVFSLLKVALLIERLVGLVNIIGESETHNSLPHAASTLNSVRNKDNVFYVIVGATFTWFAVGYGAKQLHWYAGISLIVDAITHLFGDWVNAKEEGKDAKQKDSISSLLPHVYHITKALLMGLIFAFSAIIMTDGNAVPSATLKWGSQAFAILNLAVAFYTIAQYIALHHTEWRPLMAPLFPVFHVFALVGLVKCYYHPSGGRLFLEALGLYVLTGFGITCGAHRLWAHQAYKAAFPFRFALMVLNSIACQGDIYHWSLDHRVHHTYSEKKPDPHNAALGFWYSHCGWLMMKRDEAYQKAVSEEDGEDLRRDPLVMIQHLLDPYWNLSFCFLVPALYGYYVWESFWLGFFVHGCLRWIMCLNATWCVNSAAHIWGARTYTPEMGPAENLFTAVVADGEGWHNWHHTYGFDYATSEHGALVQWNPSKVIIDAAYHLGLVWDRRRALGLWAKVKESREKRERDEVREVKVERRMSEVKVPIPTRGEYASAIPSHCYRARTLLSSVPLLRDVILSCLVTVLTVVAMRCDWGAGTWTRFGLFTLYATVQGTIWCSFWVLGYECAGGRFSSRSWMNHFVGVIVNTGLLVPYRPKRWCHEYEQGRAGVRKSIREDIFAVAKPWEFFSWPLGAIVAIGYISKLVELTRDCGMVQVFCWYGSPYLVFNIWLITYYYILNGHPLTDDDDNVMVKHDEAHQAVVTYLWLNNNFLFLQKTIFNRLASPLLWAADHLHHRLRELSVVEVVDFSVPHYHAKEALREIAKVVRQGRRTLAKSIGEAQADMKGEEGGDWLKGVTPNGLWNQITATARFTHGLVDDANPDAGQLSQVKGLMEERLGGLRERVVL
eukprot:GHVN01078590.1.p1 GENE.GHVN01078590.1~~GHVN01078590.1.p1  ORF type:complete len:960 (+),score=144.35 GHVN01078590.1:63-2882(+)